jgi:hypothetical protein
LYPRSLQSDDSYFRRLVRAVVAVGCLLPINAVMANSANAKPDIAILVAAIETYFASIEGYESGDLISRAQIAGALAAVRKAGWEVPVAKELVNAGLSDDAKLRKVFSTTSGRKLMRKISGDPGAYPRLDRLCAIPQGEKFLRDLSHKKGGEDFVRYLADTRGGHNLGKQLAATPHGVDLNKPTGRIYSEADLIAAVRQAYDKGPAVARSY